MQAYISGIGNISPQNTLDKNYLAENFLEYLEPFMSCIEPDYKNHIDAMSRRRMGTVIRRAIVASKLALEDAGITIPGAIITGTGHGSIQETESFLISMLRNNETIMNPTPFIQATYNSLSTQIAIQLECKAYNATYVHRGLSFESALQDALMLLNEGSANHVLVGGVDEITENHYTITKRTGAWKDEITSNKELLQSKTKGAIAGEGAVYFVLSSKPAPHAYARIDGMKTFYRNMSAAKINLNITKFLKDCNTTPDDIDVLISGINGDIEKDTIYYQAASELFAGITLAYYKHLCGEYFTSTAFGLWLAAIMIKKNSVPETVIVKGSSPAKLNKILFYNRFNPEEHSLILVSGGE